MVNMTTPLTQNLSPQDKMDVAAKNLASTLMSQLVSAMFNTMEMPDDQEKFMSFLSDAVGEKLADSGLTDDIAKSIKGQMIRVQEGQTTDTSYGVAAQAYGKGGSDDRI